MGTDPAEFFRLTPRLFDLQIEARAAAALHEHERQIDIAYLNASLTRVKKMPPISKLKSKQKKAGSAKPMAWQDMLAAAAGWAATAGAIVPEGAPA